MVGNSPESIKRMQEGVAEQLSTFADLIGERSESKESLYGFVPGVGLKTEADIVRNKSEEIRQGVFNVLFTGVFNGGKSTLINALIGKEILRTAAKAETATITRIMFGRNEEKVRVFYNDKHPKGEHCENITIAEYKKIFRLENKLLDIDTIDHVEIEENENKFNNLAQFIDSLGLDSAEKESEITKIYEPKASAVVFLINATEPCTISERDRIAAKYYNKHLKNVFFVVTHMDNLNSQSEVNDVKERMGEILHNVFLDEHNRFDEELFKKRVFYVNAYGAVNVRTGKPNMAFIGGEEIEIPITIEKTGVPDFEKALEEFLLSDDKYKESYKSELDKLREYFFGYEKESNKILNLLQKGIDEVKAEKEEDEKKIAEVEELISKIRFQCDDFVRKASTLVAMEYTNFVNSVRSGWDSYFEKEAENIEFGLKSTGKVAWENLKKFFTKDEDAYDEKVKEITRPISEAIFYQVKDSNGDVIKTGGYIGKKLDEFKNALSKKISSEMTGTIENIDNLCKEVASVKLGNTDMNDILKQVIVNVTGVTNFSDGGSVGQALGVLIITKDIDTALGTMTNKMSMGELIKTTIINVLVESIAYTIVETLTGIGFLYFIIRTIWGIFSIKQRGNKTVKEALKATKNDVCNELSNQAGNVTAKINISLEDSITKSSKQITDNISSKLQDHKRELGIVAEKLAKGDINMAGEKERLNFIRDKMLEAYNTISKTIGGRDDYTIDKILG